MDWAPRANGCPGWSGVARIFAFIGKLTRLGSVVIAEFGVGMLPLRRSEVVVADGVMVVLELLLLLLRAF